MIKASCLALCLLSVVAATGCSKKKSKKADPAPVPTPTQPTAENHAPTLDVGAHAKIDIWAGKGTEAEPYAFTIGLGQKDGVITFTAADADNDALTLTCASTPAFGALDATAKTISFNADKDAYVSAANAFNCKVNDGKADSNIVYLTAKVPAGSMSIEARLALAACFKVDAGEIADVVTGMAEATVAGANAFCDKLSQVKFDGKGPDPTLTAVDVK